MKIFSFALLLLVVSATSNASEKKSATSKPVKPMTLKALIAATMSKGVASTLDNPQAGKLGYSEAQHVMDYEAADTSKDTQLGSLVILNAKKKPKEIVLSSTTVTEWSGEEPTAIDGYSFRAKLSGELVTGMRAYGKVGEVVQDVLPLEEARKRFKDLMGDILRYSRKSDK